MREGCRKCFLYLVVLFFLLFSFSSLVVAVDEKIVYDKWISYKEKIPEYNITVIAKDAYLEEPSQSHLELIFDQQSIIRIPYDSCRTVERMRYCYEERDFTKDQVVIDQGIIQPAIRLIIKELQFHSKVLFELNVDESNPFINDILEMSVVLENIGDLDIREGRIEIFLPSGLELEEFTSNRFDFQLEEDMLVARDVVLEVDNEREEILSFRVSELYPQQVRGQFFFSTDDGRYTTQTQASTLTVRLPYSIEQDINTFVFERNERIEYSLTITNDHTSKELKIDDFIISLPYDDLNILYFLNGRRRDNVYYIQQTLAPKQRHTFSIFMEPLRIGNYSINYLGQLTVDEGIYKVSGSTPYYVTTEQMTCEIVISEDHKSKAGTYVPYRLVLRNNNKNDIVYDVSANITFPGGGIVTHFEKILHEQQRKTALSSEYKIPITYEDVVGFVNVTVSYRNEVNQWFSCSDAHLLVIEGDPEGKAWYEEQERIRKQALAELLNITVTELEVENTTQDTQIILPNESIPDDEVIESESEIESVEDELATDSKNVLLSLILKLGLILLALLVASYFVIKKSKLIVKFRENSIARLKESYKTHKGKDLEEEVDTYKEMIELYNEMSDEEKQKHYKDILLAYEEVQKEQERHRLGQSSIKKESDLNEKQEIKESVSTKPSTEKTSSVASKESPVEEKPKTNMDSSDKKESTQSSDEPEVLYDKSEENKDSTKEDDSSKQKEEITDEKSDKKVESKNPVQENKKDVISEPKKEQKEEEKEKQKEEPVTREKPVETSTSSSSTTSPTTPSSEDSATPADESAKTVEFTGNEDEVERKKKLLEEIKKRYNLKGT